MARAIAKEWADAIGSVVLGGFATRCDLHDTERRLDGHLRETELRSRQDLKESEVRVTVRLGAMMAGTTALTVAILGAFIALK